tara:strand:+ start:818 stop:964 length:147 start_codon:yes stop_codon:yes gene_type:complete
MSDLTKEKINNAVILTGGFLTIGLGCIAFLAIASVFLRLGAYIDSILF